MINIERIVREKKPTSWAELKEYAAAGKLDKILHSGDTIDITLKNGENVTLMVGKDQKGTIYFATQDCLSDTHVMNNTNTSTGGWPETEMRRYLNEDVFALLPDDLQAVIKPTKIVQIVDGERVEVEDKLFCFSATQVFGTGYSRSSKEPEDSQIDIFESQGNRTKKRNGKPEWWWLRSAFSSNIFCGVADYGGYSGSGASYSSGVALGFTI